MIFLNQVNTKLKELELLITPPSSKMEPSVAVEKFEVLNINGTKVHEFQIRLHQRDIHHYKILKQPYLGELDILSKRVVEDHQQYSEVVLNLYFSGLTQKNRSFLICVLPWCNSKQSW